MRRLLACICMCAIAAVFGMPAVAIADDGSNVSGSQEEGASAKIDSVDFGLSAFQRYQTGMNKTYEGASYGYAFPLGSGGGSNVCVLPTEEGIVAYVPLDAAQAAGFDPANEADQAKAIKMFNEVDAALANGGTLLSSVNRRYIWTNDAQLVQGQVTITFDRQIEDGYYYVTVEAPDRDTARSTAQFCLSGQMLPADQVTVAGEGSWFDKLCDFLDPASMDYRPLWVSLKTAGVAMVFIFILGMLAAWRAMHVKSRWKSLFDSVFTIPMVLPPTVCGFILLVIFGQSTGFGRWLIDHGIELVFSWPAAVLAATVVGFPLMYRTVLGAFEALDVNMLDAARTLGWSEARIFRKLMLPLAWPSIAAGLVLAFARAMGEFGATLFVAGNYAGVTQTMPIAIYFAWMGGNTAVAVFWVVVVIIISFIIILIINLYSAHAQRFRQAGGKASKDIAEIVEANEVSFAIDESAAAELGFLGTRSAGERAAGSSMPFEPGGPSGSADMGAGPDATASAAGSRAFGIDEEDD